MIYRYIDEFEVQYVQLLFLVPGEKLVQTLPILSRPFRRTRPTDVLRDPFRHTRVFRLVGRCVTYQGFRWYACFGRAMGGGGGVVISVRFAVRLICYEYLVLG